jgi:hypothetical protein
MRHFSLLPFLFALILVSGIAIPAQAASDRGDPGARKAAQRAQARAHRAEPQGQIACGKYGCQRIPPNCTPVQTFDAWGNPTGHDAVACR